MAVLKLVPLAIASGGILSCHMVFLEAFLPALSGEIHCQLSQSLLVTPSNLYVTGYAVGMFSLAAIAICFGKGAAFLMTIFSRSILPHPKGCVDFFLRA